MHTNSFRRAGANTTVFAWAVCAALAASAQAQLTFTTRSGRTDVQCGPPFQSSTTSHLYTTSVATNDTINVSDGGGAAFPSSSAQSHLTAAPSATRLFLANSGQAARGGPQGAGALASAGARDSWGFTIAADTRFTLSVTLGGTSSDGPVPFEAFNFISQGGARIVLDNGQTVDVISRALTELGDWNGVFTGTLRAGQYRAELFGECHASTGFPYHGSFTNSLQLDVGCPSDFDGDGFTTGVDFDLFVAAFEVGDTTADFDGDGFLTGLDFDAYVVAFEAGC